MAARSVWAVRRLLQRLLASSAASEGRGWPHPFSTATQRTAGEDCSSEDPPDELGPSLAERALKLKAVKLEKEVQDLTSFCKDLVEVADILEKTRGYISEETEPGDQKLTLEKIFRGLSLLEAKLKSVFAKHGLEKMTPIGDKYDPHEHELLCHVPARVGVQPGTVALVRQDGYKLHGRTIRLAR
ncbi:hypothetical protein GH733_001926, partial [Mirounga leonina]